MSTRIEINGSTLHTPDAEITDCWDDRASGLLSRAAALALMPLMNEQERLEAAHDRMMEGFEEGDPGVPPMPDAPYEYFVDGEIAFPGKEVTREQWTIWLNDGEPTGRVFMTTFAETMKLLEGI